MPEYQVLARRYIRPQTFQEVLGQEAIVTTLKNAIIHKRLAHAYLFCGSRGTGKTTLARVLAKALNCQSPSPDNEPCNQCSTCKEIAAGTSLDVLEIDGASHRGIDDIRQINDTVGYSSTSGKFKIYIIDEVHMLTKEAFNALLKTLEEPPVKVLFFFATTEPHKVPPTILSRCQRFNLNRIPTETILQKLGMIANNQNIQIEEEALRLIALRAEGGLRDAESLFDQILAFHDGKITADSVAAVLGIMPRDVFFTLDKAGKQGNLSAAFEIANQVFTQGKDLLHFVESLTDHFRTLLLIKLSGKQAPFLTLSATDRDRYEQSAQLYTQEQCLTIIDSLLEAQNQIRFAPSGRIALEALLLRILRIHQRIPVDILVRRLSELEESLNKIPVGETSPKKMEPVKTAIPEPMAKPIQQPAQPAQPTQSIQPTQTIQPVQPRPLPQPVTPISITEDPTPTARELGRKESPAPKPAVAPPAQATQAKPQPQPQPIPAPVDLGARLSPEAKAAAIKMQSRYDTVLQFAAVELEGSIQKKQIIN